ARRAGRPWIVTRLFGVSGPVNRAGIVEVEREATLRALLFEMAAGLRDPRPLKGVLVTGGWDVVLTPQSLDASLASLDAFSAGRRGVLPSRDGDSAPEITGGSPATH